MALFSRPSVDPELTTALRRRRVLAAGRTAQGQVLGLASALLWSDGTSVHELPWHRVDHGGWDQAAGTLRWTTTDGTEESLVLVDAGAVPDLFNERVTASIACLRRVDLSAGGSAVISARRDLGDATAPLLWRVAPGRGTSPAAVAADPLVAREFARLRAEYDLG